MAKARVTDGWIERAKEVMAKRGLTYDDLAEPLGLATRGGVSHYLQGRRELSAEQAVALAELFECSLEWFLTGTQSKQRVVTSAAARKLPAADELIESLRQMRPDAYELVTRLIAELAPVPARARGVKRNTPKK